MNDKVENLMLEHLRAIRSDMAKMATDIEVLKSEIISVRQIVGGALTHQNT